MFTSYICMYQAIETEAVLLDPTRYVVFFILLPVDINNTFILMLIFSCLFSMLTTVLTKIITFSSFTFHLSINTTLALSLPSTLYFHTHHDHDHCALLLLAILSHTIHISFNKKYSASVQV